MVYTWVCGKVLFTLNFLNWSIIGLTIFVLISGVQHSNDHNKPSYHLSLYKVHYSVIDYIPYAVYNISWLIYFIIRSLYLFISLTYFPHLHIFHSPDNHQFVLCIWEKSILDQQTVALLAQIPSWTFAFLGEDILIGHSYPTLGTTVSGCLRSCVIRYYGHTKPSLSSPDKLSFLDPPCRLYKHWFEIFLTSGYLEFERPFEYPEGISGPLSDWWVRDSESFQRPHKGARESFQQKLNHSILFLSDTCYHFPPPFAAMKIEKLGIQLQRQDKKER